MIHGDPMPGASQLDAGLAARLPARDPDASASAVLDHAPALFGAARGMGFQEAEAEDLIQDVFTTFLETLDRLEGRSQVRTWLFGILPRKTLERRRYREPQHGPIDEVLSVVSTGG